jgi:hypothetical protein
METTKTKGKLLDKLLKQAKRISKRLDKILEDENVPPLELGRLSKEGLAEWRRLYKLHCELGSQMCDIIKSKSV